MLSRLLSHCVPSTTSSFPTGMFPWLRALFFHQPDADAGTEGERRAATYLERKKGIRIVARNWRAPRNRRLEIDLVGRDGDALVFVEVKARAEGALVPGYFAAVTKKKRQALQQATRAYIAQLRLRPRTIRFDVVEVVRRTDGKPGDVLHFENVPLFPKEFLRGR